MHRLSDQALKAILEEWRPKKYVPLEVDVKDWIHAIESLCDTYGIPDAQRAGCAVKFIAGVLRHVLEGALKVAEARFGLIYWSQFTNFMVALDRDLQRVWKTLRLLENVILPALRITPLGPPAGVIAAIIKSIVYGVGQTDGILSLLRFPGPTTVAPPLGTTTNPPGQQHLLTLPAVQAIVKSWKITPYNPPSTDVSGWLSKIRELCGESGVPVTQQALCATYLMKVDCREVAIAAKCQDMAWDEFTTWLLKYDDEKRAGVNGKAKPLVKKSKL